MALEDTKKEIEQVIQKLPPITLEQMQRTTTKPQMPPS